MISNDNDLSYLDKINKTPSVDVKKLENMKKNITNYLKDNKLGAKQIEQGHKSTYMPIPKSNFDNIFLNINNIITIYMSANMDRMIYVLSTHRKYVFYINTREQYQQMEQLINILPNKNVKKIIINDVNNVMDDPFGFLYCEKK
jgi:DNA-binding LacI/PurR family transcriptional regulator